MEAISHAGAAVGIRTDFGVVLAAEKKILSKVTAKLKFGADYLSTCFFSCLKRLRRLKRCLNWMPTLQLQLRVSTLTQIY
jgi:hypothetical protein